MDNKIPQKFYILTDDGEIQSVNLDTWAKWVVKGKNIHLGQDEVGRTTVSTVFIGASSPFVEEEALLFETLVVYSDVAGRIYDSKKYRYSTKADALEGHQKIVDELKEELEAKGYKQYGEDDPRENR